MTDEMKNRFAGCLLGLAIGDSMGSAVEGWTAHRVRSLTLPVDEFLDELWSKSRGRWTDDTKMALALAESIVEAKGFNPEIAAKNYLEWFLSGDWRGMGNTTYKSMSNLKAGLSWEKSGIRAESAAGNGTAMRVAPIGLLDAFDLARLKEDAESDAIITHNNKEAINGSVAIAFAIARLVRGGLEPGRLPSEMAAMTKDTEVSLHLRQAQRLFTAGTVADEAILELGTSGYVVETVASAVYCFISSPDNFDLVIYNAIRGGKDTDTTAAVAGALAGAHLGVRKISDKWVATVEDGPEIVSLAENIYMVATGGKGQVAHI